MAQILNLKVPKPNSYTSLNCSQPFRSIRSSEFRRMSPNWSSLQQRFRRNGRVSCLFSNNRGQEEAKKAVESALVGKKSEFEKWNKEIEKREEAGGGGGGGWFRRFGWNNDNGDNFWEEAQQGILAVLGIIGMYLIIAKGEVMVAVVLNPLLYALRWTRRGLTTNAGAPHKVEEMHTRPVSAKQEVLRKWGTN